MKIEEQILLEENELRPNRYVADALLCSLAAISLVQVLNCLKIFHVNSQRMLFCFLIVLVCSVIVQFLGRIRSVSCHPSTKYAILLLVTTETLAASTLLTQWAEMPIVFPIVLAMQYHDRRVTLYGLAGSLLVALLSGPLSIFLGLPQLDYYTFLVNSIGYRIDAIVPDPDYNQWTYILSVFKYVSIPRCAIAASLGVVGIYVTKLVTLNIQSRIDATYYSITDIMTGIFNRFSFSGKVKEYEQKRPSKLICVYADANGLHELNNEFGHEAGDTMLKTCAEEMSAAFGELTYRLGGDEFLSFVESDDLESAVKSAAAIDAKMTALGYHVSLGVSRLEKGQTIDELVKTAESNMFAAKRDYYAINSKDRRRHRA